MNNISGPTINGDDGSSLANNLNKLPIITIVEQPKNQVRFRYQTERKTLLKGENSTNKHKTYITIKIENYVGPARVTVYCIDTNSSKGHVHTLTGEDCKDGAFIKDIGPDTMIASFKNIGIQRTVKNNFPKPDYIEMDKNTLRLRFEVNLLDYKLAGSSTLIAYSCPITDSNFNRPLTICKLSKTQCPVDGDKVRYIFCERIGRNKNVDVVIYDCFNWKKTVRVQSCDIHRGVVIKITMPPYKFSEINAPVKCFIQLHRKCDDTFSNSLEFKYMPNRNVINYIDCSE